MTLRRLALALAALAAGVGVVALIPPAARVEPLEITATLALGWSFVFAGLIASEQRPGSRIGPVMVLTGFAWFASRLAWSAEPALYTLGTLLEVAHLLGFGYLLLAFPSGRLQTRLERAILAVAILVVGPLQLGWMLLGAGDDGSCGCPGNLLELTDAPDASLAVARVQQALGTIASALTIGVLVRRWRRASPALRFAIAPVLWTGTIAFAVVLLWVVNDTLGEPLGSWPDVLVQLLLAAVPGAFLAGLLRARLARGGVASLVVELERAAEPGRVRDALARALRDPTLSVAYWLPAAGGYADVAGRPVVLPAADGRRAVTVVEREGRRIAALVHDRALDEDPALVESVSAAAALALENERLQAELRARLEELRASRARIVQAAQEERRRIERNLHDGTQQRLVSIAMALGLAEARLGSDPAAARPIVTEARAGLSDALAELRELSQGIHPGLLTERGLAPALDELAYRAGVPLELTVSLEERLPEPVEAAVYFLVSESLTNVAKHAGATAVSVSVARRDGAAVVEVADDGMGSGDPASGSGVRGLRDRVEALGGAFAWASRPGEGTIVRAEIPCG